MNTFYEIAQGKSYRELTVEERLAIRDRQNFLVGEYQNGNKEVFTELYDSFTSFIRGTAYRKAMNSTTIEMDDIVGIINLVLVESLVSYDAELNDNFQAYFAMNVNFEMKMFYRRLINDSHEKCSENAYRLDRSVDGETSVQETVGDKKDTVSEAFARILADQLLDDCFGVNMKKRTAVLMYLDGFRQREIAEALATEDENIESVYRNVKRTIALFRQQAMKLA